MPTVRTLFSAALGALFKLRPGVEAKGWVRVNGRPTLSRTSGSKLVLGDRVRIYQGAGFYLDSDKARVTIGRGTYLNRRTEIMCVESVSIGEYCAIAWDVSITDTDYHQINDRPVSAPISIGDRVWIGARAVILKGVSIGDGAVVAAGSVVTRDVEPGTLVAGVPARVVREVAWA